MTANKPPVCDYEGSDYRTRFWENQGREYEDLVERVALQRFLPPKGKTLIEIGAGFGRLADEYLGYDKVVLFDYSRSLLREAQTRWGNDPRFLYVAGNWYEMPFVDSLFSSMVQIRTLHHAAEAPALFQELARIAAPKGTYVLEFANKHNLKAMLRYWAGKQAWSPFTLEPIEFVELNFDFHPRWIREQVTLAEFTPKEMRTVSHFRFGPIKKIIPTAVLVGLDKMLQWSGNYFQLSPSVFVDITHPHKDGATSPQGFFACPSCKTPLGDVENGRLSCSNATCQHQWRVENGLYDFKEPLSA